MGKAQRGQREFTREQQLRHENDRLKRTVQQLRKQIARLDLDRFGHMKEIIEKHCNEENQESGRNVLEALKKAWACKEPGCDGYLEIFLYNKLDKTYYFRRCCKCDHRTKSQPYDKNVQGILKDSK